MKTALHLTLLILTSAVVAQEIPMEPARWEIQANSSAYVNINGKKSLSLFQGRAEVKDLEFLTGTIEFKIFVAGSRGFPGIHFRAVDESNFEEFYIRPHQSGNPDANQYTPVYNGDPAWQLYYGESFSAPVSYKMADWNHIRLIVAERAAEIYINNMDKPALTVALKREPKPGRIRFNAGGPSTFHFSELKVEKMTSVTLKSTPKAFPPLPSGTIQKWSVSNSFSDEKIKSKVVLDKSAREGLTWTTLDVEDTGYANLARVAVPGEKTNTTFVRVSIQSDKDQVKKLIYGFSDQARIYLNDQALSEGYDLYTSRDYRFLGTMGYFDAVYLRLKKGKNELLIAVTETFGGWGVMARFDDLEGIRFE